MAQITLRVTDALAEDVRVAAAGQGRSVNAWVTAVLSAAVDPDLSGDEAEAVRAPAQSGPARRSPLLRRLAPRP